MDILSEIQRLAPAAFRAKEQGAALGVSKHYRFMTTTDIIDCLGNMGWVPYDAKQQNSKKSPDTTRHMIIFRNSKYGTLGIDGNIPQIVLINSHDRTAALNLHIGIFRYICANGLILADETFDKLKIRHMGTSFENVIKIINSITENFPLVFDAIKRFQGVILSHEEQVDFAMRSLAIRFPEYLDTKTNDIRPDLINKSVNVEDILKAQRPEDRGNDLWLTYNRLQENIIGGGFQRIGSTNQSKSVRPLTNIRMNVMVNQNLWTLATEYSHN